ncbi:hypothetical protein L602_001000000490 [Cupriavidus gilardii J11]|uniref:Uncharacterized protein n=1 Tax=Cupriavidus gilardii J11 TaxID=936133 RepID=A0A562BVM8_9BURK|nr:hypothetical protein [Cupriavidus gilardii]TWG88850.1 hypothetical protein L602_001000000490 [Cupriavidus gilardii J11]
MLNTTINASSAHREAPQEVFVEDLPESPQSSLQANIAMAPLSHAEGPRQESESGSESLYRLLRERVLAHNRDTSADTVYGRLYASLGTSRAAISQLMNRAAPAPLNPLASLVEESVRLAIDPGKNQVSAAHIMQTLPSMEPDLQAAWLAEWLGHPAPPAGTTQKALALIHGGELSDAARTNLLIKLTSVGLFGSAPAEPPQCLRL